MSYTKATYTDGNERAEGMFFLRETLDCDNLGLTVVDVEEGWAGMEHDHGDGDHEEVYYLADGAVTIVVDDESVPMAPGDAVRVAPSATRRLHAEEPSRLVVAGAP
jgi:mannose-6-phosphate isomerase-like protein (cupin superfamily)